MSTISVDECSDGHLNSAKKVFAKRIVSSGLSIIYTDALDMALSDNEGKTMKNIKCKCKEGNSCAMCSASSGSDLGNLAGVMAELLGRIKTLTNHVSDLSGFINVQNTRIENLEGRSGEGNESCEDSTESKRCDRVGQTIDAEIIGKSRKASKREVRKEKLKDRGNLGMRSQCEESVLENVNLSASRKRTKRKQKQRYFSSVTCFSSEEVSSGNRSSGTSDSDSEVGKRCKRRRVKSGEKVKQRPVVRTELWPHTIANEDDGEDVTSEDISLSKFLSCFTYIMTHCCETKTEAAGRAILLHACSQHGT